MKKRARETPQRLVRRAEVCDRCGGVDTFRHVGRYRNVIYLRCSACGRRATRLVLPPPGESTRNTHQRNGEMK